MFLRIGSHLRVEDVGQNLRSEIDHSDIDASRLKIFRCFQSDKSGADNHCFLHIILFRIVPDIFRVIRRPHLKYARHILSVDGQLCRRCSDCDHKFVI